MGKRVLGIIVGVIILGLAIYFFTAKKHSPLDDSNTAVQSSTQNQNANEVVSNSGTTPRSLKELQASGGSQKCTFSNPGSQGTVYVSAGKVRGDFTSGTQKSHMIVDGQFSYVWLDGQTQGFKYDLNAAAAVQPDSVMQDKPQSVDVEQKMDYSCSSWSADASMFVLPSSVQFLDMAAIIKAQGR